MLGSHGQRGNAEVGWAKVGVWTARHLVLLDPTVHVCRRLAAWSGSGLTCLERCSLALVLVVGLSPQISGAANYEDIASQAGLRVPVTFGNATESNYILETTGTGAAIFDFDRDGDSDIFVVNGTTFPLAQAGKSPPLMLYVNDGRGRFTESALETGLAARGWGQGACVGDFDNDGWLDLFASGYHYNPEINAGDVAADYLGLPTDAERARLFRNRGNGTFADVSQAYHLHKVLYTMGCNYVDLDNDGWLDFYVGTGAPSLRSVMPNRMFRNAGGRVFQDVTASGGFGHLQKGHGVAVGDLDNDGDQDIYAVIGGAYTGDIFQNVLFENPGHGHRWITLLLEGTQANRSAIGARVEVQVETSGGTRSIHRTVSSGASFGASSLQQEIGLGQATAIREIAVIWPGEDAVQRFADVPLDRAYRVRQGEAALIPLVRQSVSLAPKRDGAAQGHHSPAHN